MDIDVKRLTTCEVSETGETVVLSLVGTAAEAISLRFKIGDLGNQARVRITDRMPTGMVFYPFHYPEQPANRLVGTEFDGASRTPAFKGAAARIERVLRNY